MTYPPIVRFARDCAYLVTVLVVVVAVVLTMAGCATNGVKRDDFPPNVPCVQARNDAIQWYKAERRKEPSIRPVRVLITQQPPDGQGGLTSGSGGGFLIRLWKDQYPFYGSLVHEFKHTMGPENFLSEEAVK